MLIRIDTTQGSIEINPEHVTSLEGDQWGSRIVMSNGTIYKTTEAPGLVRFRLNRNR